MSRSIAEWMFNIVLLVFATSMVAQPFVIPTGSMESTLMVGGHLPLLPYEDVHRGDMIVSATRRISARPI